MRHALLKRAFCLASITLILSGCETWSTANVALKTENPSAQTSTATATPAPASKSPSQVLITETDITDKRYRVIGDVEVTVNKTTIFHADPTRELVNQKLQEEAAKVGADAVILVRYGTVGISFMSWGSLDGKGRAIAYVN